MFKHVVVSYEAVALLLGECRVLAWFPAQYFSWPRFLFVCLCEGNLFSS